MALPRGCGCDQGAAAVKGAFRDRRPGYLRRIKPEIEIVAVIAAAEVAAALLVIVERQDPGIDLRAGRQIDDFRLVAVVDIALDRDLMPPRGDVAVGSAAGYRDAGNAAIDPQIGGAHRLVRVHIAIEPDPRLLHRYRRERDGAGRRQARPACGHDDEQATGAG